MSKKEKLIERFQSNPTDFTWSELESLLTFFGFTEIKKGKTAGKCLKYGGLCKTRKPNR